MSRTLKEWREHRGLSREELAERVGVLASMIERWEEVGLDEEPGSRLGDLFVGKVMDALEVEEGLVFPYVPDSPKPGDFIITPGAGAESLLEEIIEHAEELNLRMAAPDRWGQSLKPPKDLSDEDHAAIAGYFRREAAYSLRMSERARNIVEMLGGDSGEWRPGQTMGERLDEVGREMGEKLDEVNREAGQGGGA